MFYCVLIILVVFEFQHWMCSRCWRRPEEVIKSCGQSLMSRHFGQSFVKVDLRVTESAAQLALFV